MAKNPTTARRRAGADGASAAFAPELKQSLSDRLARRIRRMIQRGDYRVGDRLPPIMEMAERFGVGHPTVREALKKLETIGMVEIRHGSGVYVIRGEEVLVLASPDYPGTVTKQLLLDLIRARMALEAQSVADAVQHLRAEDLQEMRRLLKTAGENLAHDDVLSTVNMSFHRQIALASGNAVLVQLLDVLRELFSEEQRLILSIFGSRERDHQGHLAILEALERRDAKLGVKRMRAHLKGVEDAILRWDPEQHPVG
ncbi:MAG TPA: FadR/GntR family transcriptional regulator [Gemmatimonadales bacterium]|jgi:GntR family transcriptional repressor for pyruvate dehydrogenase complex